VAIKVFRWKAIGPLLLFLLVVAVLVWLFAEPVARDTTEEVATDLLGTQVDVGKLDIIAGEAAVNLRALQVADPFDVHRNLVEADQIRLKLNPEALTEKKLVVERFALEGMRFGTRREKPARPVEGDGFAPRALRAVREWSGKLDVPLLQLTPIDTIRQLVLNPGQLTTVKQAQALLARSDSARQALAQGFQQLDVKGTVDSATALADRLARTNPKRLGVDGTRQAIEDTRRTLAQLAEARKRVDQLDRQVRGSVDLLGADLRGVDEARRRDYAFARSLLQLPSFDAPDIGGAFFGKVSVDRFQQALYWAELARHYMPPGLLPREDPGPRRLRASGSTIRFPKEQSWPSFLLEQGSVDFTIGGEGPIQGAYAATVQGLTTAPALYGKPMVLRARRSAGGTGVAGIDVSAVLDHVRPGRVRDSVTARLRSVRLPAFDLPGLPFRLTPGVGSSGLTFALRGEGLLGEWSVSAPGATWTLDSAGRNLSDLERVVYRVVSGLSDLSLRARVSGTLQAPRLTVSSNLDRAIADRLQAVVGEEVAKAERMVRAKVDSLADARTAPARRQAAAVQDEARQRVGAEQQRLDEVEARLQAELKKLTAGLAPGIKLPKIKL
jgi:uncharacterized protein (TIGR03545 family)